MSQSRYEPNRRGKVVGYTSSRAQPFKILIVDDNPFNLSLVSDMVISFGFEVVTAADGVSALRKAMTTVPDIIFMDVIMPGMDGFETIRRLREHPNLASVPIIAVSAATIPEAKERGLKAGCDDFLTKPFTLPGLLRKLETHLDLSWQYADDTTAPPPA